MPKFRMFLETPAGRHLSNAMELVPLLWAAKRVEVLLGREPDYLPDTKSLRRQLQEVDARASQVLSSAPVPQVATPLVIAWDRPLLVPSQKDCDCLKCQAIRAAEAKLAKAVQEHPYFAPPNLKHGEATVEEPELSRERSDAPAQTIPLPVVGTTSPRRSSLITTVWPVYLKPLVEWFFGTEPGL